MHYAIKKERLYAQDEGKRIFTRCQDKFVNPEVIVIGDNIVETNNKGVLILMNTNKSIIIRFNPRRGIGFETEENSAFDDVEVGACMDLSVP